MEEIIPRSEFSMSETHVDVLGYRVFMESPFSEYNVCAFCSLKQ